MAGVEGPVPDVAQPPPGGADAAALRTLWRTVYQKAAAVAEKRAQALVRDHTYRRHGRRALVVVLDRGGSALTTGEKCDVELPWAYQLEAWALYANASGSLVVDLRTCSGISTYPTVSSICGSTPPTLTSAQAARSEDLSAWTSVGLTRGTVLRVQVTTAATITLATLTLHLRPV